MKRNSVVWKFFDRIIENDRCVNVVCKLCECQYKFFGNTTNLRVHLINKHPLQWELTGNGLNTKFTLEDALAAGTTVTPKHRKKRSSSTKNVGYVEDGEIQVQLENSDTDPDEDITTLDLVRQMHGEQQSDEEWLDDDPYQVTHYETYEPKVKRKKKYHTIKREVPSPNGLPGYYSLPNTEQVIFEDNNLNKDEYSVFGEYIANKLRKIKTSRTRGNLQQLITTILWQAEYGVYDNAETVRKVLLMNIASPDETNEDFDASNHTVQAEEIIETVDLPDEHNEESTSILNS